MCIMGVEEREWWRKAERKRRKRSCWWSGEGIVVILVHPSEVYTVK